MPSKRNQADSIRVGKNACEPRVAVTIDVEWACAEVIQDVVRLLDERNLRATFFCTHPHIALGAHDLALHPNYRRYRNSHLELPGSSTPGQRSDEEIYLSVLRSLHAMYPEALGARSHCLFFESGLLRAYAELGLQYDSSYFLPMVQHLQPFALARQVVELPIYYMDEWDLRNRATELSLRDLQLHKSGLKILDFHPNLVFLNAPSHDHYLGSKADYQDSRRLLKLRHPGRRGIRNLFLDVLDYLAIHPDRCSTLAQMHAISCRTAMLADSVRS